MIKVGSCDSCKTRPSNLPAVRPAAIAGKLSHGSKSIGGAEAYAAFTSVIQTAVKRGSSSIFRKHTLLHPENSQKY